MTAQQRINFAARNQKQKENEYNKQQLTNIEIALIAHDIENINLEYNKVQERVKYLTSDLERITLINDTDTSRVEKLKLDSLKLDEEIEKIKDLKLSEKALEDARLCFLFQCYTSLSYSDMRNFDMATVKVVDGRMRLRNLRVKTGGMYNITLLKSAVSLLEECHYVLPIQDLHFYNRNLQAIQYRAGITTHLTSHVGRHTFATSIALKNKMPIEVLQKIMGHESIRTTQIYAKVLQETVDAEFDRLDDIL